MSCWCSGGVSSKEESTPAGCMCVSCASCVAAPVESKSGCRCSSCGVLRLLVRVPLGFPMSLSFRIPACPAAPRHVEVGAPRRRASSSYALSCLHPCFCLRAHVGRPTSLVLFALAMLHARVDMFSCNV
eukprot:6214219-Pleurochrysis_carterae.AAC.3